MKKLVHPKDQDEGDGVLQHREDSGSLWGRGAHCSRTDPFGDNEVILCALFCGILVI